MIKVLKSGLLSTFQDMGRADFTDIGIGHSGAADEISYLTANSLLGDREKVCIEIMRGGFVFEVLRDISVCIYAPGGKVKINKKLFSINRTFKLKKKDIVEIMPLEKGNFLYLCIKGGFNAPKSYGSCSVNIREKILKPVKNGDILFAKNPGITAERYFVADMFENMRPELRIVFGYEKEMFDIDNFLNREYEFVSVNREAAVLKGDITCGNKKIIYEGISFGSVQISNDGISVLLKEHPTIGNLPKIGNVLPIDCFRLAQFGKGRFIFKEISLEEAKKEMIDFYSFFKKLNFTFTEMYH